MKWNRSLSLAWVLAVIGTLFALLFGEILGYEPCNLCWYQRICLFPLVLILPIALYRKDRKISLYVLPQVIVGMLIAFYQFIHPFALLYLGIVPVCTFGKDCTISPFEFFGFVNLPFISLLGFLTLAILLIISLAGRSDLPSRTERDGID